MLISLLAFPVYTFFGPNKLYAFIGGAALSTIVALSAVLINSLAFQYKGKTFYRLILGGMALRLGLVGAVLFVVWKFTSLHLITFLVSLMIFYVLLQVVEIRFFQRSILKTKH